jgi:hypothetical protein
MSTIRRGSRGELVKSFQRFLISRNAMEPPADGIAGALTDRGIRIFQGAAGLTVDGIAGPKTQAAAKERGWDPANTIPEMVAQVATSLGIEPEALEALRHVETGSRSRPDLTRFEPHVFLRKRPDLKGQIPYTRGSRGAWSTTAAETNRAAFDHAFSLAPQDAIESTSWGLWQVMGWALLRHWPDPTEATLNFFASPEAVSYAVFATWVRENPRFLSAIRDKDWVRVARIYNGNGPNVLRYSSAMREAYARIAGTE